MSDRIARRLIALLPLLALLLLQPAWAADPVRGAQLFATPPAVGQLVCIDCHSDNPQVNNFGNIFSGRNAVSLIERAISLNTGGMGYFNRYYNPADLADIAAYLGNWPASTDFGRVAVGASSALRTITIASSTKQGMDRLSLRVEGDFVLAGGDCGAVLARFSSCTVDVVFRPTAAGARSGTLIVDHASTPTPVRIALAGEGAAAPRAIARVLPQVLDYGGLAVGGAPRARTVTIANDSADSLTLGRLDVQPPDYAWVGGSCLAGLKLPPGQRCSISLQFAPRQPGARPGQLSIGHDGVGGESRVELLGRGDAAGPWLEAEPAWLDFGVLALGGLPATPQTLTIHNRGAAAWQAPALRLSDAQFSILRDGCAGTALAPGRYCQIVVAFEPRRAGPAQAELLVDAGLRLPMVGRVVAAGGAWLAAEPGRPLLEAVAGQSATLRVTLTNRGAAALPLQQLVLGGADAADFAVLPDSECQAGLSLPAGAACGLTLRFAPASGTGPRSARLRVEAAAAAPALLLDLRGLARDQAASQLWLDAQALGFAARQPSVVGDLQTLNLMLNNRGGVALRWRSLALSGTRASDFRLLPGDCAAGLAAGASCRLQLSFQPGADAGAGEDRLASLVLQADDAPLPATVPLRGRAPAVMPASPRPDVARLDFGRQPLGLGSAVTRSVRLVHDAAGTASPPLLRVEGPFQIESAAPACARGWAPGEVCTLALRYAPQAAGPSTGRLLIQTAGAAAESSVALVGEAVETAPLLVWQAAPAWPSHADTAVGSASSGETLVLLNRGNATSEPLLWQFGGPAAADFSIDMTAAGCLPGQRLAAGESCRLRLRFHPRAAGLREAGLHLGGAGAAPLLSWPLQGRGQASVAAVALLLPAALDFAAEGATPPPARALWLRNEGSVALALESIRLQGNGFAWAAGASPSCADTALVLLPGEACALELAWLGRADGAAGNALLLGGDALLGELGVPLTVSESPSLGSNVGGGGGGGGVFSAMLLLWLALAALALPRPSKRPHRR